MNKLPKIYYCKKCDRYTDVRFISDKKGGRDKSYCYKCSDEMLEPIDFSTSMNRKVCWKDGHKKALSDVRNIIKDNKEIGLSERHNLFQQINKLKKDIKN